MLAQPSLPITLAVLDSAIKVLNSRYATKGIRYEVLPRSLRVYEIIYIDEARLGTGTGVHAVFNGTAPEAFKHIIGLSLQS